MGVASHAEAWIETASLASGRRPRRVASHAEAWIETATAHTLSRFFLRSPPMRRRGLKRGRRDGPRAHHPVASHAEAWIETLAR